MFNALPPRSFISLPPSVYESCLPFGIDPPLAANEKELCFLGLEAGGPSGFGASQLSFFGLVRCSRCIALTESCTELRPRYTLIFRNAVTTQLPPSI